MKPRIGRSVACLMVFAMASMVGAAEPVVRATSLFNGRDLTGWQAADKFDFERHGAVRVVDGAVVMEVGQPATGVVWKGETPRVDYELKLEAKRLEGNDFFCGLTFPIEKSYCTLILGGWGGTTTGLSNIDDMSAVENDSSGSVDFQNNRWYRVRLRVTRKAITAWVDDERILEVETSGHRFAVWWEQEPMRPLGIAAWQTKAAIRKIELLRLPNEKP